MKIFHKNSYFIILSKEEAIKLTTLDNIEQYYSEKYSGYVFSPMINYTGNVLSEQQVAEILRVIDIDDTTDITDKLTLINA